jgi:hypothetical protein
MGKKVAKTLGKSGKDPLSAPFQDPHPFGKFYGFAIFPAPKDRPAWAVFFLR